MANRCMKRCSKSLITSKVQIRTPARDHCAPVSMVIRKRQMCKRGHEEKEPLLTDGEGKSIQPLWKDCRVPQKTRSIQLVCKCLWQYASSLWKVEIAEMTINWLIDKVIYLYSRILFSLEKLSVDILYIMRDPWTQFARCRKPFTKGHTL